MENPDLSLGALLSNELIWVSIFAWFVAGICKVIYNLITEKKFELVRLVATGGMPSTHTAPVIAFTTLLGILYGLNHTYFTVGCVISIVVMYDAANIRQEAGKHAEAINIMFEALIKNGGIKQVQWPKMRELLGHTYLEVFVGALIGVLVAVYGHQYWLAHWGETTLL